MKQRVQQLVIHGMTLEGQRFVPATGRTSGGGLSQFRPSGSVGSPLTYSPYVVPVVIDGIRCVVVDHRLRELSPWLEVRLRLRRR